MKNKIGYLLWAQNANTASDIETQTLPFTFKSNGRRLKNYRIYGNTVDGESVGDLVETGEHSGEYVVPVKIEGKNLLQNTATNRTINQVKFTVNDDGGVTCNGTATSNTFFKIGTILTTDQYFILTGCPTNGGHNSYLLRYLSNNVVIAADYGSGTRINQIIDDGFVEIRIASGYNCDNLTFYPMIRKADIKDNTYEPYQPPITTNLYLPEPLKIVGDEAEYIDYKEQKQHFADGTSADVTLPAIPILFNTNTLSVGTTVQPSKVYLQGKISEPETVSSQSLQMNMQSLQLLSLDDEDLELDVMPTDNDLQIDVKPIEKPVLNLNYVSEIENAEIERGVESAE